MMKSFLGTLGHEIKLLRVLLRHTEERMKRLLFWIIIMTLSLMVGIGLCEGIVRLWGMMDTLPESLTLHLDRSVNWLGGTPVFNAEGLRDRDYPQEKPQDTYRILLLGDSITYGVSVPWEYTYAKRLERLLNTRHQSLHFEVINAGVPGWNIVFEKEFLKTRGLAYKPDMVMIGFCLNDAEPIQPPPNFFTLDSSQPLPKADAPISARAWALPIIEWNKTRPAVPDRQGAAAVKELLSRYSHLYRFIRWRADILRRGFEGDANYPHALYGPDSESWHMCRNALQDIARVMAEGNGKTVLVIFPFFIKLKTLSWLDDRYPWAPLHEQLTSTATALNMAVVDLLPYYKGYDPRDISVDPYHPNALGHRIAAEAIYTALVDHRLIPAAGHP
jgi:lysophospholipase L1-like esterase